MSSQATDHLFWSGAAWSMKGLKWRIWGNDLVSCYGRCQPSEGVCQWRVNRIQMKDLLNT